MDFAQYFKNRRKELGYTARKFSEKKEYDVAYISRLENGLVKPPAEQKKIKALAKALELEEETEAWTSFFDLVAIARNEIPQDLQNDEQALRFLPAFYRSRRSNQLDKTEVDKLLKLIDDARGES